MHCYLLDEDLYDTVVVATPCTACKGDTKKCIGMCNGSVQWGKRLRSIEEIAKIKAERKRRYEDAILAEADAIRAARANEGSDA